MMVNSVLIESKVDELLFVLDRDIEHIEENLVRLTDLRAALVKRDDGAMSRLLEEIRSEGGDYRFNELKRNKLRGELAAAAGCDVSEMTLSRLRKIVSPPRCDEVAQKRQKLNGLVEQLKRTHSGTAMLLRECSRINSMLLRSILKGQKSDTVTYNSAGTAKVAEGNAFINLKL